MSKTHIFNIFTTAFFVGLNMILGVYFLLTVRGSQYVPASVKEKLADSGIMEYENSNHLPTDPAPDYSLRVDLNPSTIITLVNQQRKDRNNSELSNSKELHQAALHLLQELKKNNFSITEDEGDRLLSDVLKNEDYSYTVAYQTVVIGPVTAQSVIEYWSQDKTAAIFQADVVTEIGVATSVEAVEGQFTGYTAVLLAKPLATTSAGSSTTVVTNTKPTLPDVSDEEVIAALNLYRSDHKVAPLNVNGDLCGYAQKRVGDLVAFGGLDNHQGFKADFADPKKKPEALQGYSGTMIGENLAHQFCRNMTTGESFIAGTGTALIEWCFDSSTKGHREAQLSPDYKNVCVRHADGMYVVTFGN